MINKALLLWSVLAGLAIAAVGAWIAFSPHGAALPGGALVLMAALLLTAAMLHGRNEWGRYQLKQVTRPSRTRHLAASASPPRQHSRARRSGAEAPIVTG